MPCCLLRSLDMPLAQVADVISALDPTVGEATRVLPPIDQSEHDAGIQAGERAAELLGAYWNAIERRIASQRELAAHLQIRMASHEGNVRRIDMFDIKDRAVPEQLVLTEQRHVHIDDMPAWLPGAMQRVRHQAEVHGGAAGHLFVIYHGEVSHDSDGPAEVCVSVSSALESVADLAIRREPPHREVYVRITKAQWEVPQILSAYDAVSQYISSHELRVGVRRRISVHQLARATRDGRSTRGVPEGPEINRPNR
jgi:hypothetical protein